MRLIDAARRLGATHYYKASPQRAFAYRVTMGVVEMHELQARASYLDDWMPMRSGWTPRAGGIPAGAQPV